ncbi:type II toxin-antitoxin system RelE/ParE family toxin [Rouxiella sp. Mn2063]|uniref:type II toxin-antitoxin system RelE/ParE family toxin n=1 Tax=Rouxiella sp. Mn2063 TaxID=3395262 RepID=UPI003BBBD39F
MWDLITTDTFDTWLDAQDESVKEDIIAMLGILKEIGPNLGRPYVDNIRASNYPNMKELRVQSSGLPFRGFFAFDPLRQGIILCAGNKKGLNEEQFYTDMIAIADAEYAKHLKKLSQPEIVKKSTKKGK